MLYTILSKYNIMIIYHLCVIESKLIIIQSSIIIINCL